MSARFGLAVEAGGTSLILPLFPGDSKLTRQVEATGSVTEDGQTTENGGIPARRQARKLSPSYHLAL